MVIFIAVCYAVNFNTIVTHSESFVIFQSILHTQCDDQRVLIESCFYTHNLSGFCFIAPWSRSDIITSATYIRVATGRKW